MAFWINALSQVIHHGPLINIMLSGDNSEDNYKYFPCVTNIFLIQNSVA